MKHTEQIRTLFHDTELVGRVTSASRLELLAPAPLALAVYFGDDPEAGLRDLFRVHMACQRNADLLRTVDQEDQTRIDDAHATRERLRSEIAAFVGPPRGWAHAQLRHQALGEVDRVLGLGVRTAESSQGRRRAARLVELIDDLEHLDDRALWSLELSA